MATYGSSLLSQDPAKSDVLIKTSIGGFIFDAYIRLDHNRKTKITQHPVETGASITDHAYVEPAELIIEVGMSDACVSYIEGQFGTNESRSVAAFKILMDLQEKRIPMDVTTRLKHYKNMLIEAISVPDDWQMANGLKASVTLREIIVVGVKTTKMKSSEPHKTGSTNMGTVQPEPVNESVLRYFTDTITGGNKK